MKQRNLRRQTKAMFLWLSGLLAFTLLRANRMTK